MSPDALFATIEQVHSKINDHERNLQIELALLHKLCPVPSDYNLREIDIYFRGLLDGDKLSKHSTGLIQRYRDEVVAAALTRNAEGILSERLALTVPR